MTSKVVEYKTLTGDNRDKLDIVVVVFLDQGWSLLGGGWGDHTQLYQTMVKYEKEDKPRHKDE